VCFSAPTPFCSSFLFLVCVSLNQSPTVDTSQDPLRPPCDAAISCAHRMRAALPSLPRTVSGAVSHDLHAVRRRNVRDWWSMQCCPVPRRCLALIHFCSRDRLTFTGRGEPSLTLHLVDRVLRMPAPLPDRGAPPWWGAPRGNPIAWLLPLCVRPLHRGVSRYAAQASPLHEPYFHAGTHSASLCPFPRANFPRHTRSRITTCYAWGCAVGALDSSLLCAGPAPRVWIPVMMHRALLAAGVP